MFPEPPPVAIFMTFDKLSHIRMILLADAYVPFRAAFPIRRRGRLGLLRKIKVARARQPLDKMSKLVRIDIERRMRLVAVRYIRFRPRRCVKYGFLRWSCGCVCS